jgi:hypothetical protein
MADIVKKFSDSSLKKERLPKRLRELINRKEKRRTAKKYPKTRKTESTNVKRDPLSVGANDIIFTDAERYNYTATITGDFKDFDLVRFFAENTPLEVKESSSIEKIIIGSSVQITSFPSGSKFEELKQIEIPNGNPNLELDQNGVLYNNRKTILLKSPVTNSGELVIPNTVRIIADYAFYNNLNLQQLTYEGTPQLETIGREAFYNCESMYSQDTGDKKILQIPDSLRTIGVGAFALCRDIYEFDISDTNTTFSFVNDDKRVLYSNDSKELLLCLYSLETSETSDPFPTIPDTVEIIGAGAFYKCTKLRIKFAIPNSIKEIKDYAFYECENLNVPISLEDKSLLETIGDYAFYRCTGLSGNLTIPASVRTIGDGAFEECDKFTSLIFAEGTQLTTIGDYTFSNCYNLSGNLTIPASVETIGDGAFEDCDQFTSLIFAEGSNITSIGDKAFFGCDSLSGYITIPNSLITMGGGVFNYCENLVGIKFEADEADSNDNFCLIDGNKILYSKDKKELFFCLYSKSGSLVIPNSVETIHNHAFEDCEELTGALTIPASVRTIGYRAFFQCYQFTSLIFAEGAQLTTIGDEAFGFNFFSNSLVIPASVQTIGDKAFSYCILIPSLSFENGSQLTTIGISAFKDCVGISNPLDIPSSVETIIDNAFYNCIQIPKVRKWKSNESDVGKSTSFIYSMFTTLEYNDDSILHPGWNNVGRESYHDKLQLISRDQTVASISAAYYYDTESKVYTHIATDSGDNTSISLLQLPDKAVGLWVKIDITGESNKVYYNLKYNENYNTMLSFDNQDELFDYIYTLMDYFDIT